MTAQLDLRVRATLAPARTVVHIGGEIDLATSSLLTGALDAMAKEPRGSHVVVDLSGLTFIGAEGIRLLGGFATQCTEAGGSVVLRRPPPLLQRIVRELGLALLVEDEPGDGDAALAGEIAAWATRSASEERLVAGLQLVVDLVPRVAEHHEASVSLRRGHSVLTAAASDPAPERLDEVQYALGDGPCLTALRAGRVVYVDDLPSEHRWPEFAEMASREGIVRITSLPLEADGSALGALNVYNRSHAAFDGDVDAPLRDLAELASALLSASVPTGDDVGIEDISRRLAGRTLVAQAQGALAAQRRISPEAAFSILATEARGAGRGVVDHAALVLASVHHA